MALNPIPEPPFGLLDRVGAGDDAAFEAVYRLYAGPVFTVAARMLARALRSYRGDGPFWGWLRRIVVNKVLMRMRAERSRPTLVAWEPDEHAGREDWSDSTVLARDLEQALAALPPLTRAVVWLYDVEGWTHPEIAAAVGRSESFSKSQLSRAHQRLRGLLEDRDERTTRRIAGLA